jgi:ribosomal protein L11 methyltransferase
LPDDLLTLSFDLGPLDPQRAEEACFECGASAVTFLDAHDDPVLEPAPGEFRLWRKTRVQCLFQGRRAAPLTGALAAALGLDAAEIALAAVPERAWEREWLKHFHALRFGRRLWVCPRHEAVSERGAAVVLLDPGLAFGTGTHPSTALCLEWLDAHLLPGTRVIDYGCGSGVLALAAARLGAQRVHCFDIDPQALLATADNAQANGLGARVEVHGRADELPPRAQVLLANILARPLIELAPRFAALLAPGGVAVLAGLMRHEAAHVTAAYGACFDVVPFGEREEWVCLVARCH